MCRSNSSTHQPPPGQTRSMVGLVVQVNGKLPQSDALDYRLVVQPMPISLCTQDMGIVFQHADWHRRVAIALDLYVNKVPIRVSAEVVYPRGADVGHVRIHRTDPLLDAHVSQQNLRPVPEERFDTDVVLRHPVPMKLRPDEWHKGRITFACD